MAKNRRGASKQPIPDHSDEEALSAQEEESSESEGEDEYELADLEEAGGETTGSDEDEEESEYDDDDDNDDEFEDQGSSDEEELLEKQADESDSEAEEVDSSSGRTRHIPVEALGTRKWARSLIKERQADLQKKQQDGTLEVESALHIDDLSSDDEEAGNTIGRVPLRWYEHYEHIGYNLQGQKIMKKEKKDGLAAAIAARDDPNFGRTVYDALNDREVVLSDRDMEIIRRIQSGAFPHPEYDAQPEYIPYYTADEEIMPLDSRMPPKHRFTPSKWETMKIMKLVQGLKNGTIMTMKQKEERAKKQREESEQAFAIWKDGEEDEENTKGPMHIPAPKMPLPGHAASYRPPDEYLMSEEEIAAWKEADPSERELDFIPQKFDSLRQVGAYSNFVRERFDRCLDLYLCPRVFKRKLNIDPESLVPQLPKASDLKPFPTTIAVTYKGHQGGVRCLTVSKDGQFLASGDSEGGLRVWEVSSGKCMQSIDLGAAVNNISWNPNPSHQLIAASAGSNVYLITTGTGGADTCEVTDALLAAAEASGRGPPASQPNTPSPGVEWDPLSREEGDPHFQVKANRLGHGVGVRVALRFSGNVTSMVWHRKGDYLATVVPSMQTGNVMIHQISKRATQVPFKKPMKTVQGLSFHPNKPFFFVATQQHVRVYHLLQQRLVKKLLSGCKWISSIDVHPSGDHVIIGSYDRRLVWFDMDLSSTPYKTLKYHTKALRAVQFHKSYPLMATSSDDGTVHVFHSTVYSDLMRNPFIVPVKVLRGHTVTSNGVGVLSIAFHPSQPWVFSGGADHAIHLHQDL